MRQDFNPWSKVLVNQGIFQVPQSVIEDAAQLVKANSIQGNKMNDVDVVSFNQPKLWLSKYWIVGVHNVGEPAQDERDGRGSDRVPQAEGGEEDQAGFQGECHCQPIEQDKGAEIAGKLLIKIQGGKEKHARNIFME